MAIRPNNEERGFGADRERQREISNESGRTARTSGGETAGRADAGAESSSSPRRSNRGFASMDRTKQREIASKGGRAAHQKGTAHEFDSSEARAAGRKGGVTVSRNREHMAAIGRRGGEARGANRAARLQGNAEQGGAAASRGAQRFQTDREVGLSSNSAGAGMNAGQGTARPSGKSLGGERRPATSEERNVERP
jgi:general stress protein YciG